MLEIKRNAQLRMFLWYKYLNNFRIRPTQVTWKDITNTNPSDHIYKTWPVIDLSVYRALEIELESDEAIYVNDRLIPGVLQTEQYARMLLAQLGHSNNSIDQAIGLRYERQKRLMTQPSQKKIIVLLDEACLLRVIGNPSVMYEQLQHLISLCQRRTVELFIFPLGRGLPLAYTQYPFSMSLYRSTKNERTDLSIFIEPFSGEALIFGSNDLQAWHIYRHVLTCIHDDCRKPEENVAFLERIADSYLTGSDINLSIQ